MGVDNNGVLFLGLPERECDLNIDGGYWEDFLIEFNDKKGLHKEERVTFQCDNGYSTDEIFIGYKLADSGSYGYKEVTDLPGEIVKYTELFKRIFEKDPKIYILNYQW